MHLWSKFALGLLVLIFSLTANAERVFRIATSSTAGTYHELGVVIAKSLSRPGAIRLQTQNTRGSVANLYSLAKADVESIFAQADEASWALRGTFMFAGRPRQLDLRLIANLYPESIHVVVRQDSGILTMSDLRGKRVSLGWPGSGTHATALTLLRSYGLSDADIRAEYVRVDTAADKLHDGELDAFFFVGGAPAKVISDLVATGVGIALLPIQGVEADRLRQEDPFLTEFSIDSTTYNGVAGVSTLAVRAQWLTSARVDAKTVYELTKSLFSESAQTAIRAEHPNGKHITLQQASQGSGVALHAGAERFYREVGALK